MKVTVMDTTEQKRRNENDGAKTWCAPVLPTSNFLVKSVSYSRNCPSRELFMMSKEDVFAGVKEQLIEALAVDDDQVTFEATLMGDLGAESIDLLDIVYRLEKAFSIKIDRGELVPDDIVNDTQGKYVIDGKLTALGLEEIKSRIPFADLTSLEKNPVVQNLATVLTVRDMCYLVEQKLGI